MTIQFKLKKRAYASNLKSRALSVLIYLIDRSNKELTCFPAIPTIASELHISVSTVKRALHELVESGFVVKESRFRENNRGQTSNLYTLTFTDTESGHDDDSNQPIADDIDNISTHAIPYVAEQITFEAIAQEEKTSSSEQTAGLLPTQTCTPVRPEHSSKKRIQTTISCLNPQVKNNEFTFNWTGVGFNLIPP